MTSRFIFALTFALVLITFSVRPPECVSLKVEAVSCVASDIGRKTLAGTGDGSKGFWPAGGVHF